jgi:hypothetical protein
VLIVASNPTVTTVTGRPVGFGWAELTWSRRPSPGQQQYSGAAAGLMITALGT